MKAPKKVYDFDSRNLPEPLLRAIGLTVASSAQTEGVLELAIAGCAGLNSEYGKAFTTHMNMPLRYSVLRSLAEIRFEPDILDILDGHIARLDDAFGKRNAIAHNSWCRDTETEALFRVREDARSRVELELIPTTVEEVEAIAADVYQTGMDLMQLLMTLDLLPPVPTARRERDHKTKAARKKRRKEELRGGAGLSGKK